MNRRTYVPAKIEMSLNIRTVCSEFSLGAFRIAKDARFLHADNEDSDLTVRVHRLVWVFTVHTPEGTFSHVAADILHETANILGLVVQN